MARLSIAMLGPFEVALGERPVTTFEYDKVRALLAYLATEADRPQRRETLAGLFWPERCESSARQNLSQALLTLRHAIGDYEASPPFLQVTPQTLQFNPASNYQADVTTFLTLVANRRLHAHQPGKLCAQCLNQLHQAVALYRGNFLEGFSLADSPAFEEWAVLNRERLHRLAVEALEDLAADYEHRRQYKQALPYAWGQVELEPWQETGHRQLMRLLALTGQRESALVQYQKCQQLLAEELGVEPAAETQRLYEQIRAGELATACAGAQRARAPLLPFPAHSYESSSLPPLRLCSGQAFHSSNPTLPFVARQVELAQLDGFLAQALANHGQVVFVTGGPGRGKTSLLGAFARRAQEQQPDLIVVGGQGNALTGSGDSYRPFREILGQLTGDQEAVTGFELRFEANDARLEPLLPCALQAVIEVGPDLIDTFVPGDLFIRQANRLAGLTEALDTAGNLEQRLVSQATHRPLTLRPQGDLLEQYTRVLHAVAQQQPLLVLLDDLQWADVGSIGLLFHLARRLDDSRILIVAAYRPAEVSRGRWGERHPLEPVVNELKLHFGPIEINLSRAEDRHFVDTLLDVEPNGLGEAFRQTLFRLTAGHPLFTVELLRGMQERGDLIRDQRQRWIEGPKLDWDTLPARVEAVLAERVGQLSGLEQAILTVASVEGEIFTAEVIARVQGRSQSEIVHELSTNLERTQRLVHALGVRERNGRHLSQYRFCHCLFQKYLYSRLDPVERVYLHEAVGLALEKLYGESAG